MSRTYEPLADRLVVKPMEREELSKGGIILPDTAKDKPHEGEVLAVGPGRFSDEGKRIPLSLKTGDQIIYTKFSGTEVKNGDEQLLILTERDVLAKITRNSKSQPKSKKN